MNIQIFPRDTFPKVSPFRKVSKKYTGFYLWNSKPRNLERNILKSSRVQVCQQFRPIWHLNVICSFFPTILTSYTHCNESLFLVQKFNFQFFTKFWLFPPVFGVKTLFLKMNWFFGQKIEFCSSVNKLWKRKHENIQDLPSGLTNWFFPIHDT